MCINALSLKLATKVTPKKHQKHLRVLCASVASVQIFTHSNQERAIYLILLIKTKDIAITSNEGKPALNTGVMP
jgi:hypothetical protein